MTRISRIAVVALVAALAITSLALAAPKKGPWLSKLSSEPPGFGPTSGIFRVASGPSIRPGRQLRFILVPVGPKCGVTVAVKKDKIRVRNGRFAFNGKAYYNAGDKPEYGGELNWRGRFTTRKKVKGTLRFVSPRTPKSTRRGTKYPKKRCDTGTLRWRGRYSP